MLMLGERELTSRSTLTLNAFASDTTDIPMSASTGKHKTTVAITAFAIACLGLIAGVRLLVPSSGDVLDWLKAPAVLEMGGIMAILFGAPIVGAILGGCIGGRLPPSGDPPAETPIQAA